LRLQLHGEDAARRDAVLARMNGAIAHAKQRDATTDCASREELARAVHGAGDYRAPAISREKLWAVVEGPTSAADVRCATAEALATSGDEDARARLRVAAAHCADPRVRVALQEIAEPDELDEADSPVDAARRL
jgi:hypothetical protein